MAKELTPEQQAKLEERKRVLGTLTNRQRLADTFHRLFHSQGRRFVYWRKQWYQWTGTHYIRLDEQMLESVVIKFLEAEFLKSQYAPPNLTRGIVGDVLKILTARCSADAEREAPFSLLGGSQTSKQHISLANGVLDVSAAVDDAQALYPHDPEWFSLTALPFRFDPLATCPKWDRFLTETFEGDTERMSFIEEWMGYCCTADYSQQHAVILTGEGANGKGVLTKVLIGLVGEDNCSHVPLETFGHQFALEPTLGKLLNSAPEISSISKTAEEQLKAITGGDRLTVTIKYGRGINTKLTARLMFSTNELPAMFDRSGGTERRLIIIPFNRVVPAEERNPKLHEELLAELPGIFNKALGGLRRLRQRGHFAVPAISIQATKAHMLSSNPARTFLTEECREDPTVATLVSGLFSAYTQWFNEQGYPKTMYLAQPQFAQEVARIYHVKSERHGQQDRRKYYYGLRGPSGCEMKTT